MSQQVDKLTKDILSLARNTLLVNMRFLDVALGQFVLSPSFIPFGTDGHILFYNSRHILLQYKEEKEAVTHNYLHLVMHCIFHHPFIRSVIDRDLWNLACDIAVEATINDLDLPHTVSSKMSKQLVVLGRLRKDIPTLTAEKIYHHFLLHPPEDQKELEKLFWGDDHSPWYIPLQSQTLGGPGEDGSDSNEDTETDNSEDAGTDDGENTETDYSKDTETDDGENTETNDSKDSGTDAGEGIGPDVGEDAGAGGNAEDGGQGKIFKQSKSAIEQTWEDISKRIQMEMETFSGIPGKGAGGLEQNLKEVNREKYDYTSFLKKFAVMGEVMQIDPDQFDYIFYTYGLQLYKNVPLIEPLEYREMKRIREFVIAIDTSGSVSGELVQAFVQKTYNILKTTESFFSKINLHIIQCDAEIQEHIKITTQSEFDAYIATMSIKGFGGTDFRPVFALVDEMIMRKEFINLKGLIYFTDGVGAFPQRKPGYDTAFIFVQDEYNDLMVPPWAIKLILQREEIEELK